MKSVSFYHKDTGIFHPVTLVASDDDAVKLNTPVDHIAIDNPADGTAHDRLCRRVDVATKEVVDYQPPAPSDEHYWHSERRRWELKPESVSKQRELAAARARIVEIEQREIPRAVLAHLITDNRARLQTLQDELAALDTLIKGSS